MDIKLESEDANFAFPEVAPGTNPENKSTSTRTAINGINLGAISGARTGSANSVSRVIGVTRPRPAMGVLTKRAAIAHQGPVTLTSQLCTFLFYFLLQGYVYYIFSVLFHQLIYPLDVYLKLKHIIEIRKVFCFFYK